MVFAESHELDTQRAKDNCCFAIVTIATCGVGMLLGGMCWFMYKNAQYMVRAAVSIDDV